MLTSTYNNRPQQRLHGLQSGGVRRNERGTVYRVGTDDRGRPIEVTLAPVDLKII